ncbi:pentapeptide repeat-containing protein [Lyngbya aestuarii]|uniref:pentapeptide repeat-containing protein n=1 Tax=Lyngbya aestuarii TaxID=118322 RepID=UPI00403E3221
MASPTIKRVKSREGRRSLSLRVHLALPLVTRRCLAVLLEASIVVASALVPYGIGLYANQQETAQPVPLNPVLASTEEALAKTLAYPLRGQANRWVAPLTNLFWCSAIAIPVAVVGRQVYLLGKTGQTTAKRWFGVQVVTVYGTPPGLVRAVWREGVGRSLLPSGTAYLLWRYTGAFPNLGILLGMAGFIFLAESACSVFHSRRRALHDQLAGTYVLDAGGVVLRHGAGFPPCRPLQTNQQVELEVESRWGVPDEQTAHRPSPGRNVTTIVISPKPRQEPLNFWLWMRRHPGLTLLIVSFGSMACILGTFFGTQVYIQGQANQREFKQQKNEVFLALVRQLSSTSATAIEERQGAILALARLEDDRAVPLLVDLLAQEKTPSLINALEQGIVSSGSNALPALRRLNQSLENDQKVLQRRGTVKEQQLVAWRQQATNRAIVKIITIYAGQLHYANLSAANLGQFSIGAAQFTLILDNLDLSGINFRSASLNNASLRGSRFYGPGEDQRFGTFDDWITDFSGADLKEVDLTGAILNNAVINRSNLIRASLNRVNLSGSSLVGTNLSSAQLIGADLKGAILENASLTGAYLGEAKLAQSNLRSVLAGKANAIGADFSFADLTQSSWQEADLSGANLSNARLRDADLSSTKLVGANLRHAQLQNAKLRNSNLSSADLQGANLAGADLQGATFAKTTPVESDQFIEVSPNVASVARIKGVNFAKVKNLDAKQIKFICVQGGRHPECP